MSPLNWSEVDKGHCYAVAKYRFYGDETSGVRYLSAELGERVVVQLESQDWVYGCKLESDESGIIPKSYLWIQESEVRRSNDGAHEMVRKKENCVAEEARNALKIWMEWYKVYYEKSKSDLKVLGELMASLHANLKLLTSKKLTVEDEKALIVEMASQIDRGNHLLKLGLTVRDENGTPLDPQANSMVRFYRAHQNATEKLLRVQSKTSKDVVVNGNSSSQSLLVTVEQPKKISDELEFKFFLCGMGKESELSPFTEAGVFHLKSTRNSQGDIAKGNEQKPLKILFSDLCSSDFDNKKVFLVCFVARIGAMEFKETENGKNAPFGKSSEQCLRRPHNVGCIDVTSCLKWGIDDEQQFLMPLIQWNEDIDQSLQKAIASSGITENKKTLLSLSIKLLQMDPYEIKDDSRMLLIGKPLIARKMGFPDVIYPLDIRNDLYISLSRGEFHKGVKAADKNVEISASLHCGSLTTSKKVLFAGAGVGPLSEYKSVVYYHADKPKWNEYFKVVLPLSVEEFFSSHIRFVFKHRSSSESKDKQEKPFALAYLRLSNISDSTALKDSVYDLCVYKIDSKSKNSISDMQSYLPLPSLKSELKSLKDTKRDRYSLSTKDSFCVKTVLCSTKFTQEVRLLNLLQWVTKLKQEEKIWRASGKNLENGDSTSLLTKLQSALERILQEVPQVNGEEIFKFLPDVFDALFNILVDPLGTALENFEDCSDCADLSRCDEKVFDCLIHILSLMRNQKFEHFESVLTHYLEESFSSTLAYKKLTEQLIQSCDIVAENKFFDLMRCLPLLFRFILKSFKINDKLKEDWVECDKQKNAEEFVALIDIFFTKLSSIPDAENTVRSVGMILKHVPEIIEQVNEVFPLKSLNAHLIKIVNNVSPRHLKALKIAMMSKVVHSSLFKDKECRFTMLPTLTKIIKDQLESKVWTRENEQLGNNKAVKILGEKNAAEQMKSDEPSREREESVSLLADAMDILHEQPVECKTRDISLIIQLIPSLTSLIISSENSDKGYFLSVFLAIFRELRETHYKNLVSEKSEEDKREVINGTFVVFLNCSEKCYFPVQWKHMISQQNLIILDALQNFSKIIKSHYTLDFEYVLWEMFFECAIRFMTQESLQMEKLSAHDRTELLLTNGDLRKNAGDLIDELWFGIVQSNRMKFPPSIVGYFLKMGFVADPNLRKLAIRIIFDITVCEHNMAMQEKRHFCQIENELVERMIEEFENGKGDEDFCTEFKSYMKYLCDNNRILGLKGLEMINTISNLLGLLLDQRSIMMEENTSNEKICVYNLLGFCRESDRKELYLQYVYKLFDLNLKDQSFGEAAFTLKLHSKLLDWVDDCIPKYQAVYIKQFEENYDKDIKTQFEFKRALCLSIISYFTKAEMWECALEICDEMRCIFAKETYDYEELPPLLKQMAALYENILRTNRFKPEYYRVAYYGLGFRPFLRNKVFVHRGGPYEKLSEFEYRLLKRSPGAEPLRTLTEPPESIKNSNSKYIQVCSVRPVMDVSKRNSHMECAVANIRTYYQANEVDKFSYSRPYHEGPKNPDNEFSTLCLDRYELTTVEPFPGAIDVFQVLNTSLTKLSPIQVAIEEMIKANTHLKEIAINITESFVKQQRNDGVINVNPLTMKLNGILDAAVNGGTIKYEEAFLKEIDDATELDPWCLESKLLELMFRQIHIIYECLQIHCRLSDDSLKSLEENMFENYQKRLTHLRNNYCYDRTWYPDRELQNALRQLEPASISRNISTRSDKSHSTIQSATATITRGFSVGKKMNFSSASLNQSSNHKQSQRSQRRSTHSSVAESFEFMPSYSTLPRKSSNSHAQSKTSIDSDADSSNSPRNTSSFHRSDYGFLQRCPRVEQRQIHSWGDDQNSLRSKHLSSPPSLEALKRCNFEAATRKSTYSNDSQLEDFTIDDNDKPPELPPKSSTTNLAKPPPKPPLRK